MSESSDSSLHALPVSNWGPSDHGDEQVAFVRARFSAGPERGHRAGFHPEKIGAGGLVARAARHFASAIALPVEPGSEVLRDNPDRRLLGAVRSSRNSVLQPVGPERQVLPVAALDLAGLL